MPGPRFLTTIRHLIGRAIRETGQALDRVGIRGHVHAETAHTHKLGDDPYKFQDHLSRHRNIMPLLKRGKPKLHENIGYIAPCSSLVGTVHLGEGSSVWYGAVLRADTANMGLGRSQEEFDTWRERDHDDRLRFDRGADDTAGGGGIFIGSNTNVQDGCIITAIDEHTTIGNNVTIGHCAQLHSTTVEDNCLIGMGSVLNPGSKVETLGFVAAGAVIGKNQVVKSGELWVGNPARKLRDLTQNEKDKIVYQAHEYVKKAIGQSPTMELGGNLPRSNKSNKEK